jgi:hypothetical protein
LKLTRTLRTQENDHLPFYSLLSKLHAYFSERFLKNVWTAENTYHIKMMMNVETSRQCLQLQAFFSSFWLISSFTELEAWAHSCSTPL